MKDGENIGLCGFGASGHLVMRIIKFLYPNSKIFVFARSEREKILQRNLVFIEQEPWKIPPLKN